MSYAILENISEHDEETSDFMELTEPEAKSLFDPTPTEVVQKNMSSNTVDTGTEGIVFLSNSVGAMEEINIQSSTEEAKDVDDPDADFVQAVTDGMNYEDVKVSGCIIGASGAGKSALINSICDLQGPQRAKEGGLETTTVPTPYTPANGRYTIWDIPGAGTDSVPPETYAMNYNLQQYDFVIVMLVSPRLTEAAKLNRWAIDLVQHKLQKHFFLVYSRFDTYVFEFYNEKTQFNVGAKKLTKLTAKEQQKYIEDAKLELSQRANFPEDTLYIGRRLKPTSQADKRHQFDYDILAGKIFDSLSGRKRDIVVENFKIYNEKFLQEKKDLLKRYMLSMSIGSAAAGAIPVPGPGIAVDFTLLLAFFRKCKQVFGLKKEDIRNNFSPGVAALFIPRVAAVAASIGATLAFGTLDDAIKTIPLVGSIIGAVVGVVTSGPLMYLALNTICNMMADILKELMIAEAKKQAESHYNVENTL